MARLPVYTQQTSAQGSLGPGPVEDGRSPVGAALVNIGEDWQRRQDEDAVLGATSTLAQTRTRWSQAISEQQRIAESGEPIAGKVAARLKAERADLIKGVNNRKAKQWLTERLDTLIGSIEMDLLDRDVEENARHRAGVVDRNVAALLPGIEANPAQYADALDEQLAIVRGISTTPEARDKMEREVRASMSRAAVMGLLRSNPELAAAELQKPQSAIAAVRDMDPDDRLRLLETARKEATDAKIDRSAAAVLKAYEGSYRAGAKALAEAVKAPGLTEDERATLASRVRAQVGLLSDQRSQANVDNLVQLERLQAAGDPKAERLAATLYDRGALSELQYAGVVGQLETARKAARRTQDGALLVGQAIASGTRLDPKDEKTRAAVDDYFVSQVANLKPGSSGYNLVAAELAKAANVPPESAVSWARANLFSENVETATQAADLFSRLSVANPSAYEFATDEKTRAMAAQVTDAITAGASPQVALANARKAVERTPAEEKFFKDAYSADKGKIAKGNIPALRSMLNSDDRYDPNVFGSAPAVPPALAAEFESQVQRYFPLTGGDAGKARELAFQDMTRTWGRTEVNGKPELMRYAPEVMFPGLTSSLIRADLAKSLDGKADASKVRLIPTPDTARSGGRLWQLQTFDEWGAPDVLRGENGRPLTYSLPLDQAAIEAAQASKVDKEEFARQRRERQLQYEAVLERMAYER